MSNLVRTILVPEALLSTVQSALSEIPEASGMFSVPCYTSGTATLAYYISYGSVSTELVTILEGIEGVDVSAEDCQTALSRLNLSLSSTMPEEV